MLGKHIQFSSVSSIWILVYGTEIAKKSQRRRTVAYDTAYCAENLCTANLDSTKDKLRCTVPLSLISTLTTEYRYMPVAILGILPILWISQKQVEIAILNLTNILHLLSVSVLIQFDWLQQWQNYSFQHDHPDIFVYSQMTSRPTKLLLMKPGVM